MSLKIDEALRLLIGLGLPRAQQNERTALCLLALTNIKEESEWADAENLPIGITPMMDFSRKYYNKVYAPNTRETFRRFSMHQLVQAGIALYNPDNPARPVNSPKAVYQISPEALEVVRSCKTIKYEELLNDFTRKSGTLAEIYARERNSSLVPVKVKEGLEINLSPGEHNSLIKEIIENMAPGFLPGAELVYIGDTGDKWGYFDEALAAEVDIHTDQHGKMPDVIFFLRSKHWLILVESVTSHGPIDSKRMIELNELFSRCKQEKVYITAFPTKQIMARYAVDIAWETEVWVSENPTHMIHFNGEKFLGPY